MFLSSLSDLEYNTTNPICANGHPERQWSASLLRPKQCCRSSHCSSDSFACDHIDTSAVHSTGNSLLLSRLETISMEECTFSSRQPQTQNTKLPLSGRWHSWAECESEFKELFCFGQLSRDKTRLQLLSRSAYHREQRKKRSGNKWTNQKLSWNST